MFQLSEAERESLRSQFVISNRGGRRYLPYAFTEEGVAMLSGLLKSHVAVSANIQIMRAFVKMRRYALAQTGSDFQIAELRKLLLLYMEKNDKRVDKIIEALNRLISAPPKPKDAIGFKTD
jgi:hypothetical protein